MDRTQNGPILKFTVFFFFFGKGGESSSLAAYCHHTEIVGSDLCAEFPHHFPSRLFYPRFDVSPANLRTNPLFCQQKITSPTTSDPKRYPTANDPTKKANISAPIPTPQTILTSPPPNHCFPPTRPLPVRFPLPVPARISTSSSCAELVQTDSTRATTSYFISIY